MIKTFIFSQKFKEFTREHSDPFYDFHEITFCYKFAVGAIGQSVTAYLHNRQRYWDSQHKHIIKLDSRLFMNVTFDGLNFSKTPGSFFVLNSNYKRKEIWLIFYRGNFPKFQIVPPFNNITFMVEHSPAYNVICYQVLDAKYLYHRRKSEKLVLSVLISVKASHNNKYQTNSCVNTFVVKVTKFSSILFSKSKAEAFMKLFDGPHTSCEEIYFTNSKATASTFQARFIVLNSCSVSSVRNTSVTYRGVKVPVKKIFLRKSNMSSTKLSNSLLQNCSFCPSNRLSVFKILVPQEFHAVFTFKVSATGFTNFECSYGGMSLHMYLNGEITETMRKCKTMTQPQSVTSPHNMLFLTYYSYTKMGRIAIEYSLSTNRCGGVLINPLVLFVASDPRHKHLNKTDNKCGLKLQMDERLEICFAPMSCTNNLFFINYKIQPGECAKIQLSHDFHPAVLEQLLGDKPKKFVRTFLTFSLISDSSNEDNFQVYEVSSTCDLRSKLDRLEVTDINNFPLQVLVPKLPLQTKLKYNHSVFHFENPKTTPIT